jgi:glycosyltransferase involved in cell wall biosynthesis
MKQIGTGACIYSRMRRFSIVMASYLGDYDNAAKERDKKIHRAIRSVISQSFQNWELLIVADGCKMTLDMADAYRLVDDRIRVFWVNKQKNFSGKVRNTGIHFAHGEYICYLDIDDFLGPEHLSIIDSELKRVGDPEWVYLNDFLAKPDKSFEERKCLIYQKNKCGTSNVVHKREKGVYWNDDTYEHDWIFINDLRKINLGVQIATGQYMTCHYPHRVDV